MADKWPEKLTTSKQVADALNWLRWRSNGAALFMIAIGRNSIAIARAEDLTAEDAIAVLQDEIDTMSRLLRILAEQGKTHGSISRPGVPE